jgi:predicted DNA-binding transcriptional regulator YafY
MQVEIFQRLARIDYLIRHKATGSPSELAKRLGISERSVYEYLNLMKEFGAPIKFNNFRQTYYYDGDGMFNIAFMPKKKKDGEDTDMRSEN